ncbi:MAG: HEAT repeat domain-containing protein [Verrucomicrobia bacterium]|nr:HEAT repeat domain-containing protein [Verrucomicrobiota bacterium]
MDQIQCEEVENNHSPMKRHKLLFGLVFVLFLSAFVIATRRKQPAVPDPVYNGKHASEWAREYVWHFQPEAEDALKQLGADATPFLLPYVDKRDSLLNSLHCGLWTKLPSNIRTNIPEPILAWRIRLHALAAFQKFRSISRPAIPELIQRLNSKDYVVRYKCIDALGVLGPEAKEAVPALRALLKASLAERVYAAIALWEIEHDAAEVLPIFEEALKCRAYGSFAIFVARFLPQIGSAAEPMIPLLVKYLNDLERYPRPGVMLHAMAGISTNSIPYLIIALKDKDSDVRANAAVALGEIGPPTAAVIDSLEALLADEAVGLVDLIDADWRYETISHATREALCQILGKATNDSDPK